MFCSAAGLLVSLIRTPHLEVSQQVPSGIPTPRLGDYRRVFITGPSLFCFLKAHSPLLGPARNNRHVTKMAFSGTNKSPATVEKREEGIWGCQSDSLLCTLSLVHTGQAPAADFWDQKDWAGVWQGAHFRQEKEVKGSLGPSRSKKGPTACIASFFLEFRNEWHFPFLLKSS